MFAYGKFWNRVSIMSKTRSWYSQIDSTVFQELLFGWPHPPDIAQDARDHFIAEHKICKLTVAESDEELLSLGRATKVGEQTGE